MVIDALEFHCWIIAALSTAMFFYLWMSNRLQMSNMTLWTLAAFVLYFVVHPFVSMVASGGEEYMAIAQVTGGVSRVRLATLAVGMGMVGYFVGAEGVPRAVIARWGAPGRDGIEDVLPNRAQLAVLLLFGLLAIYGLIVYRGAFGLARAARDIDAEGRFVGNVTGYQIVMHKMGIVPMLVGLGLARWRKAFVGVVLVYLAARLFDPWDRASLVSVFVALLLMMAGESRGSLGGKLARLGGGRRGASRLRPAAMLKMGALVFVLLAVVGVLQVRGHRSINEVPQSSQSGLDVGRMLAGADTGMLPAFYVKSWIYERKGRSYGGIVLSRALFGVLPRRFFPWKDELARVIAPGRRSYVIGQELGYHIKDSLVGTMYRIGGLWFIPVGMFLIGLLGRRLESGVATSRRLIVRVGGYSWTGMWWMVVASSLEWSLNVLFVIGLPAIVAMFFARRNGRRRRDDEVLAGV